MAIAYPAGTEPPAVEAETTTPAPTATSTTITLMTTTANSLDCGNKTHHPASPSFTMNVIEETHSGITPNPLLTVNMGSEGTNNPFITPTVVTNHQGHSNNRNTFAFKTHQPEFT